MQDVTNPNLFQSTPVMSHVGTLTAFLTDQPVGSSTITFRAVDDGVLYNSGGQNTSLTARVTITLKTLNMQPSFSLPWQTRCTPSALASATASGGSGNTSTVFVQCSCQDQSSSSPCTLVLDSAAQAGDVVTSSGPETAGAVVYGRQGAAHIEIRSFATDITPAVGIRPSSDITFAQVSVSLSVLGSVRILKWCWVVAHLDDDGWWQMMMVGSWCLCFWRMQIMMLAVPHATNTAYPVPHHTGRKFWVAVCTSIVRCQCSKRK